MNQHYIRERPTDQNAIDIFKGEWSSKFPESFNLKTTGLADLFDDQRIHWAKEEGVVFRNKRILELGPLEAGHTWMMNQLGTSEILAIEANERAYLKCLIVKEITQMGSVRFVHGNFEEYLKNNKNKYDICLASGVLYHSNNPIELLENICRCTDQIILWSHYFDKERIDSGNPKLIERFDDPVQQSYRGKSIYLHRFNYLDEADSDSFCGGMTPSALWLERLGIEEILHLNQFEISATGFDHPSHPNGPAIALIANRIHQPKDVA